MWEIEWERELLYVIERESNGERESVCEKWQLIFPVAPYPRFIRPIYRWHEPTNEQMMLKQTRNSVQFLNGPILASFGFFSFISITVFLQKNCRLQWDSNSYRRSWSRARAPLDHSAQLILAEILTFSGEGEKRFFSNFRNCDVWRRRRRRSDN